MESRDANSGACSPQLDLRDAEVVGPVGADTGFYRKGQFLDLWHPVDYVKPSLAIARLGFKDRMKTWWPMSNS